MRNRRLTTLAMIIAIPCALIWFKMSDGSGVYVGNDPAIGMITLSLDRDGDSIKGKIFYGNTAPLNISGSLRENHMRFKGEMPQEWIKNGQKPRVALFNGQLANGTVKGRLSEGPSMNTVELSRDGAATLMHWISALMPF